MNCEYLAMLDKNGIHMAKFIYIHTQRRKRMVTTHQMQEITKKKNVNIWNVIQWKMQCVVVKGIVMYL